MRLPKIANYFLSMGVLLLALANIGDVRSHFCLDGQEAFASVHFENFDGHPVHDDDIQHVDVDDELRVGLQASKLLDLDTPLLNSTDGALLAWLAPLQQPYFQAASVVYRLTPAAFLPPPRAPPVFPA